MKDSLKTALTAVIAQHTALDAQQIQQLLEQPKNKEHGDLAFPCFLLAKDWKLSPPQCAAKLEQELSLPSGFSAVKAIGPFLNFSFDRMAYIKAVAEQIISEPENIGRGSANKQTVIVEYSSPNIAKPFHVGHLRATLIGNCLDRLYRHLGYSVQSVNHLGDWGTQFGFVWAGCKIWGKPEENCGVIELVDLYRKSTALKEAQEKEQVAEADRDKPDVNEMARAYFVDLEAGKKYAVEFWQWCLDISLAYFKETYQRLGIQFDHYTGESFYSDMLDGVLNDLKSSGLLVESKGALGVDLGEKLGFARVATPDGRSLYLTRDLATAKYRAETFNFDKCIYVVGAPQTLHFQQIVAVLAALGREYASKIEHVAFGHVLGIKTRGEGMFIELNDFIDEATKRSLEAYHEQVKKRPEGLDENAVATAVALSGIIFSTLSRTRMKDVHFDWKHALEFQGDSGPYLLYAYARINGIHEKAKAAGISWSNSIDATLLSEDSAYELAATLGNFSDVLQAAAKDNEPTHLATYALEVAKAFSRAYNDLQVIGAEADLAAARLTLFEATKLVLGTSLRLLGIEPIERM